jgi:hypothetical protein
MSNEHVFEIWAPPGGLWSDWVKPVLFSYMPGDDPEPGHTPQAWDTKWAPDARESIALVFDLPGVEGVAAAIAVAAIGYRPVPLYNAIPTPISVTLPDGSDSIRSAAVDAKAIMGELYRSSRALAGTVLPPDAPPAFLLDANRRGAFVPAPRDFDNRSVCFTTDFPSADFLKAQGIRGAVLVQASGDQPQADLAHTLRCWQKGGIELQRKRLDVAGPPAPLKVTPISVARRIWEKAMEALGLRQSPAEGFGRSVPEPGSGG